MSDSIREASAKLMRMREKRGSKILHETAIVQGGLRGSMVSTDTTSKRLQGESAKSAGWKTDPDGGDQVFKTDTHELRVSKMDPHPVTGRSRYHYSVQKYGEPNLSAGESYSRQKARLTAIALMNRKNESASFVNSDTTSNMGLMSSIPVTQSMRDIVAGIRRAEEEAARADRANEANDDLDAQISDLMRKQDVLKTAGKDKEKGGEYDDLLAQLRDLNQARMQKHGITIKGKDEGKTFPGQDRYAFADAMKDIDKHGPSLAGLRGQARTDALNKGLDKSPKPADPHPIKKFLKKAGGAVAHAMFGDPDDPQYEAKQKLPFEHWMKRVDQEVNRKHGVSVRDLPDAPFADWHERGVSPVSAASKAVRAAKGGEFEAVNEIEMVVHRQDSSGKIATVGGSNQTILQGKSLANLHKKADDYANGGPHRIEILDPYNHYKPALKTYMRSGSKSGKQEAIVPGARLTGRSGQVWTVESISSEGLVSLVNEQAVKCQLSLAEVATRFAGFGGTHVGAIGGASSVKPHPKVGDALATVDKQTKGHPVKRLVKKLGVGAKFLAGSYEAAEPTGFSRTLDDEKGPLYFVSGRKRHNLGVWRSLEKATAHHNRIWKGEKPYTGKPQTGDSAWRAVVVGRMFNAKGDYDDPYYK